MNRKDWEWQHLADEYAERLDDLDDDVLALLYPELADAMAALADSWRSRLPDDLPLSLDGVPYLTEAQAARLLPLKLETLQAYRRSGYGPRSHHDVLNRRRLIALPDAALWQAMRRGWPR